MASKTIIVMSDSHSDRQIVADIKAHWQDKVDAIFHNGDSELPSNDKVWDGIQVVQGNCDYDDGYPQDLITDLGIAKVAQTHGHLYHINFMWDRLDLFAQEADADICLYGHLHRAAAWKNGKTLFVNPGSVSQPRGEVLEKLYAKLEISDSKIKVDFYKRNHELYPALSEEFDR